MPIYFALNVTGDMDVLYTYRDLLYARIYIYLCDRYLNPDLFGRWQSLHFAAPVTDFIY